MPDLLLVVLVDVVTATIASTVTIQILVRRPKIRAALDELAQRERDR